MRIGMVCPYSLTIPGGVQNQVLGLARALRRTGEEVRVLAPCDGPPPDSGVTPLGRSVPTASNGSVAPIAPDPAAVLRTIRAVRDEGFDLLHLHEPLVPGPTTTCLFLQTTPMVGTFHAAGDGSAGYKWLRPLMAWGADRLSARVAVSDDARVLAEANLGGSYEVLYNAVEVERFAAGRPAVADTPTVFFCGRHEPRKGLAVLLEALPLLPEGTRIWVGSDGPETADLRRRTAGDARIDWLGRISDDEKVARLRGADVFCAPSLGGESFGIVLLEGMAAGTPVVASDLPGYAKVARDGVDALLVPPGDAPALAAAVARVIGDHGLAERLVASGRSRAEEFSMAGLAEAYLDVYRSVVRCA